MRIFPSGYVLNINTNRTSAASPKYVSAMWSVWYACNEVMIVRA